MPVMQTSLPASQNAQLASPEFAADNSPPKVTNTSAVSGSTACLQSSLPASQNPHLTSPQLPAKTSHSEFKTQQQCQAAQHDCTAAAPWTSQDTHLVSPQLPAKDSLRENSQQQCHAGQHALSSMPLQHTLFEKARTHISFTSTPFNKLKIGNRVAVSGSRARVYRSLSLKRPAYASGLNLTACKRFTTYKLQFWGECHNCLCSSLCKKSYIILGCAKSLTLAQDIWGATPAKDLSQEVKTLQQCQAAQHACTAAST